MSASPFGRETRTRVLNSYFRRAASQQKLLTCDNAWEHVYYCLLWINAGTGLAHIYDSNHMQRGGTFHSRAVRFTDALCRQFLIDRSDLSKQIDCLFRGCAAEWQRQMKKAEEDGDQELEAELLVNIKAILVNEGIPDDKSDRLARKIKLLSHNFYTIGRRRNNALGEGFEDLMEILLLKASGLPPFVVRIRNKLSQLPGFRTEISGKEPKPDIAIVKNGVTKVLSTAKWSLRQDRQVQFISEHEGCRNNRLTSTIYKFFIITNEFDVARLRNTIDATVENSGYRFDRVYHINVDLLKETHAEHLRNISLITSWEEEGRLSSLSNYLKEMRERFGHHTAVAF